MNKRKMSEYLDEAIVSAICHERSYIYNNDDEPLKDWNEFEGQMLEGVDEWSDSIFDMVEDEGYDFTEEEVVEYVINNFEKLFYETLV